MFNTFKSLLILTLLAITFKSISSKGLLPKINTASVYQSLDKTGPNLTYTDDMELWSDFNDLLMFSKLKKASTICVQGAWLIYNNSDFQTPTPSDVQVFSGTDNCIQPPNMMEIGSMQPIGPYKFQKQSITVFEKKYFGSFGLSYSPTGTEIKKFRSQWLPQLESLITVGKSSWTLVDYEGRLVCVKPMAAAAENSICLGPTLIKYRLPKSMRFVGVFAGCGKVSESIATFELTDCKEFGSTKMEKVIFDSKSLGRALAAGCQKPAEKVPLKEDLIKKFTKLRFEHDFSSKDQILWPQSKTDIWKTEILDTVFDIMLNTCPNEVVPTKYLEIIRELTVYQLDKAWRTNSKNISLTTEIDKLALDLNDCLRNANSQSHMLRNRVLQAYNSVRSPKEFTEGIYAAFNPNPKFDIVIDSAWIVANYALGLCHHLTEYTVDFWTEYINIVRDLYFLPLFDRWQNPKDISAKGYGAILGGFGTDIQFQRLGFCASVVFDFTPNMIPFEKNLMK